MDTCWRFFLLKTYAALAVPLVVVLMGIPVPT